MATRFASRVLLGYNSAMSEAQKSDAKPEANPHLAAISKTVIHRVCITCNGMFKVTADNFTAKHCPKCHKG